MTGYKKILDRYDENVINPSEDSQAKVKEFFKNNRAYSLCKYDQQLNIIDSADFVSQSGEELEVYMRLKEFQAMDLDEKSNIYLVNPERGFKIKVYSGDLKLKNEFICKNSYYRPIPKDIEKTALDKYRNGSNQYSIVYALYVIRDEIITTFYQNVPPGEKPIGPYFFDIFTKLGQPRYSGSTPFPIFARDDSQNLYLYVKVEGGFFFSDNYYLVQISAEELSSGLVDREFVLSRIDANKKD
jgi:hypothetical protein